MEFSQLLSITETIINILREDNFSKHANHEIYAAKLVSDTLHLEKDINLALARLLGHLESAFVAYSKCVWSWNLLDYESVIFKKAGKLNKIIEGIAEIHYHLGNTDLARKWLFQIRSDGEYNRSVGFYKHILGDEFIEFEPILTTSDYHRNSIQSQREIICERAETDRL